MTSAAQILVRGPVDLSSSLVCEVVQQALKATIKIICKFTILSTQAEGVSTKIQILLQRPDLVLKCSIFRSLSRRDRIKTFNFQAKTMRLNLGEI